MTIVGIFHFFQNLYKYLNFEAHNSGCQPSLRKEVSNKKLLLHFRTGQRYNKYLIFWVYCYCSSNKTDMVQLFFQFWTALIQRKSELISSETELISADVYHVLWMSGEKRQNYETVLFSGDYLWDFNPGSVLDGTYEGAFRLRLIKTHQQSYFGGKENGVFPSCKAYFSQHCDYHSRRYSAPIEEQFPVAFGILVYRNFDQLEQLLRAIYKPHNYYCIHVDRKASESFRLAVSSR